MSLEEVTDMQNELFGRCKKWIQFWSTEISLSKKRQLSHCHQIGLEL